MIEILTGRPAAKGIACGPVRVIQSPSDLGLIQAGDILVTHMTEPQYVPAMMLAAAIITDIGGAMCHAAVVARELGKPCVVAVGNATTSLKQGQMVRVDGLTGKVYEA